MKRFTIILLAVATALVMALPATAKKPVKPKPEPEPAATYEMTIEALGMEGIETTCIETITVTRSDARRGAVTHFESTGAELRLTAGMLDLPDGCHGEVVRPPTPEPDDYFPVPEYFRVTLDGDQVAMLWIFDVEFDENGGYRTDYRMGGPYEEVVNPKNGKTSTGFAKWTECSADRLEELEEGDICLVAGGTVPGETWFYFVQYEAGRDPMFVPLTNASQDFALQITLIPTP